MACTGLALRGLIELGVEKVVEAHASGRGRLRHETSDMACEEGVGHRPRLAEEQSHEAEQELVDLVEAVVGAGGDGPFDELSEACGEVVAEVGDGAVFAALHTGEDLHVGACGDGSFTCEELVEDDAERVDVAAVVEPLAACLFGAHVGEFSAELAGRGSDGLVGRDGDAEVDEFGLSVARDEDVGGRDVAVDEAEASALLVAPVVDVGEAAADLGDDEEGELVREASSAGELGAVDGAEVPAVHMVHGEEEGSVVLSNIEDGDEVAVREARGDAGLFEEAAGKGRVFCEVGEHALDDELLLPAGGALHACEVDLAHAAAREEAEEFVASELYGGVGGFQTVNSWTCRQGGLLEAFSDRVESRRF